MLHIHFADEQTLKKEVYKENVIRFYGVYDIEHKFCSFMEKMYFHKKTAYLRSELICTYLKERYDVEWADNYSLWMDGINNEFSRAPATILNCGTKLTMMLLHYQSQGNTVFYLADYVPEIMDLKWLSEHAEMTVYLSDECVLPVATISESDYEVLMQEGLFEFIHNGIRDSCSWAEYKMKFKVDVRGRAIRTRLRRPLRLRDVRMYCSKIDPISIHMLESGNYEIYNRIMDVPDTWDAKYVYGFGIFPGELNNPLAGQVEKRRCIEFMLSDYPKHWTEI